MSRSRLLAVGAAVLVVVVIIALMLLRRGGDAAAEPDATPTAVVTVAPVRAGTLHDVVSVYGVVTADPAAVMTVAAPKQVIVQRVLVRTGQTVAAGQPVIEVMSAPAAELAYRQAADAAAFARADLARVQRLYDERLAANDQLETARKALADANAALSAQQKQGGGRSSQALTAPAAGVVTNIAQAPGDHVAQDAPLVVLARSGGEAVKLGLEPGGRFAPGQPVTIRPVAGGAPIQSRLTMVGRAADQTTKTIDAVAPLNGAPWAIGAGVQGDVVTGAHAGMVVPRAAVVFDETGPHLFTVAGGKAHRVFVQVGLDHGDDIEVKGPLQAGALVAVEGAYELQDGMAVKVRGK
ncbi:efflux RND transporter periplasmic adaptor subunit [Phenylobacterium sp.]|uniref:efflux RND transporter periplasmic adaptor subunit n=1 Tax=Phenylobacterium sp. TaxID=1871053 RepID=UPI002DEE1299|nr:efflux RND transporter periplasmic adaptor subunit [Phenylobacterium sp.]